MGLADFVVSSRRKEDGEFACRPDMNLLLCRVHHTMRYTLSLIGLGGRGRVVVLGGEITFTWGN